MKEIKLTLENKLHREAITRLLQHTTGAKLMQDFDVLCFNGSDDLGIYINSKHKNVYIAFEGIDLCIYTNLNHRKVKVSLSHELEFTFNGKQKYYHFEIEDLEKMADILYADANKNRYPSEPWRNLTSDHHRFDVEKYITSKNSQIKNDPYRYRKIGHIDTTDLIWQERKARNYAVNEYACEVVIPLLNKYFII